MVVLWNFKYGMAVPHLLLLITFGEALGSVSKSTLQDQAYDKRSYLKQGGFHKGMLCALCMLAYNKKQQGLCRMEEEKQAQSEARQHHAGPGRIHVTYKL